MKKGNKNYFKQFSFLILVLLCVGYFSLTNRTNDIPKEQWALKNNGQEIVQKRGMQGCDINIEKAWSITKGDKEIIVGILDSGIEEKCRNIYMNKLEIIDGIDNDGNGYIDDISGWDFFNCDNSIYDGYIKDYHGTYITNIITGNKNYLGVAPNITIMPLKFMSGTEGDTADAVTAIEYAHNAGVKIINCSWDFKEYDEQLYSTIKKYDDILFVCASGKSNLNLDESSLYPASYKLANIISVMAIDNQGKKYDYSGFGKSVDVAAPGVDILCQLPEGDEKLCSGTSIAAAYVSGIASLILSVNNELKSSEVVRILKKNVKKIDSLKGEVDTSGIVDAYSCLKEAQLKKQKQ